MKMIQKYLCVCVGFIFLSRRNFAKPSTDKRGKNLKKYEFTPNEEITEYYKSDVSNVYQAVFEIVTIEIVGLLQHN